MIEKTDCLFNETAETIRLESLCSDFMLDKDYNDSLCKIQNKLSLAGSTILVCCTREYIPEPDKAQKFVDTVKLALNSVKNKKIYIVLDKSWENGGLFNSCSAEDTLYIDYFLGLTYFNNKDLTVAPWNKNSDKFLFLTGRWHRLNRTTLLYYLWDRGLLENCEWSWGLTDDYGQKLCPELTQEQYRFFIKSVTRSMDSWGIGGSQHYTSTIYSDKLFELVSETKFEQDHMVPAFVTEKTWKTIANGLPFIIAGPPGILESLENLGFDTFDDLLLVKNYDNPSKADYLSGLENWMCMSADQWKEFYSNIRDVRWPDNVKLPDTIDIKTFRQSYPAIFQEMLGHKTPPQDFPDKMKRLNAIIANVDHWLENLPKYADKIADRVLRNQQQFNYQGKKVLDQLSKWTDSHNLSSSVKIERNL